MCQRSTLLPAGRQRYGRLALGVLAALAIAGAARAQTPGRLHPDWRHIGNSVIGMALAAPASGPVERLWYSPDGSRLYVRTAAGTVFETADFEKWRASSAVPPAADPSAAAALVPSGTRGVRAAPADGRRLYAYGEESCARTMADAPGPTSPLSADAPSSAAAFAISRFRRSTARKWSPRTRTGCGGRSTAAHPGPG